MIKQYKSKLSNQFFVSILLALLAIFSPSLLAAEQLNNAQENSNESSNESYSGGFLKLGAGYKSLSSPYSDEENEFSLFFDGRYQWANGLYVEVSNGANALTQRSNGDNNINKYVNFGYNFYNTKQWNIDANIVQVHSDIKLGFIDRDQPERSFFIHKDMTDMLGVRATGNFEQFTLQFEVAPYSFNPEYDDGLYASLWLSKQWQIKNWAFSGSVGAQYRSKEIISYYYELDGHQATDYGFPDYNTALSGFNDYKADSGVNITTQLGMSYPLSEHWLFESYIKYTDLADSIVDSPVMFLIVTSEGEYAKHITEAGIILSYVF